MRRPNSWYNRPVSRREALVWIATLSAGAGAGLCGVGGLLALLAGKRARSVRTQTATQVPLPIPTAGPVAPDIVTRDAWNARPVNHQAAGENGFASAANPNGWLVYPGDLATVYHTVALHHSYPVRSETGTMRELQNMHMDYQQWADIAYHFGVGPDGRIYAGRDIGARGASVAGYNTGVIGVVAIGDFEDELPGVPQLEAIQRLIIWLKAAYTLTHIAGHGDFNPETVCPGRNLRPYIDIIGANVGLVHSTGGYVVPTPISMRRCC